MAGDRILPGFQLAPEEQAYRVILGADPAAGAEVALTMPSEGFWELRAVTFQLVTSADAANRFPRLSIDDGTTTLLQVVAGAAHTASLTVRYTAGPFGAAITDIANGVVVLPLPPLILPPGFRITTSTVALEVLDDYGPPAAYVREVKRRGDEAAILAAARAISDRFEEVGVGG